MLPVQLPLDSVVEVMGERWGGNWKDTDQLNPRVRVNILAGLHRRVMCRIGWKQVQVGLLQGGLVGLLIPSMALIYGEQKQGDGRRVAGSG